MLKIDDLNEKEILNAINIMTTKYNMLRVFFNLLNKVKMDLSFERLIVIREYNPSIILEI